MTYLSTWFKNDHEGHTVGTKSTELFIRSCHFLFHATDANYFKNSYVIYCKLCGVNMTTEDTKESTEFFYKILRFLWLYSKIYI